MKLLIAFVSALLLIFAMTSYAATSTMVTTTVTKTVVKPTSNYKKVHHYKHAKPYNPCKRYKHKKHVQKIHHIRTYYQPGYCVTDPCSCSGKVYIPGHYVQCRTEYYYNDGRNSARVEVCY